MARLCAGRIAAGALALGLAACGGGSEEAPRSRAEAVVAAGQAPCPRIALLADGADLTRFRPGAPRDLPGLTLDARITGFDARCDFTDRARSALEVRITPRFEAERGPAAAGRTAELPWFVAVTDPADQRVVARTAAATRVDFPANVARASATGQPVRITVPGGAEARAHIVRLSFQLTPEELELNRARGPR